MVEKKVLIAVGVVILLICCCCIWYSKKDNTVTTSSSTSSTTASSVDTDFATSMVPVGTVGETPLAQQQTVTVPGGIAQTGTGLISSDLTTSSTGTMAMGSLAPAVSEPTTAVMTSATILTGPTMVSDTSGAPDALYPSISGSTESSPPTPALPATTTSMTATSSLPLPYNVVGGDMPGLVLSSTSGISQDECQQKCTADGTCYWYNYKEGDKTCTLESTIADSERIIGIKGANGAGWRKVTGAQVSGTEVWFGQKPSVDDCKTACETLDKCVFYAYRPSTTGCSLRTTNAVDGVVTGFKNE